MTLAFAELCECGKGWFTDAEYNNLQATFLRARDASLLCILFFSNQPFVQGSDWMMPDAKCYSEILRVSYVRRVQRCCLMVQSYQSAPGQDWLHALGSTAEEKTVNINMDFDYLERKYKKNSRKKLGDSRKRSSSRMCIHNNERV